MTLERLHPDRGRLTPAELARGLRLGERAGRERPYLVINMVATPDGRITISGRAGPIGDEHDRELFHHLRTQGDAIMVGAGTARTERYGPLVKPELRDKRQAEGVRAEPLGCIVSGRLELPPDLPLLQDPGSEVVVLTGSRDSLAETAAQVSYLRSEGPTFRLAPLVNRLRTEWGVRSIVCEGGPTLNAWLFGEGLVDELFLTLAPKLAGGADPLTLISGPAFPEPIGLELLSAAEGAGALYLRYRVSG